MSLTRVPRSRLAGKSCLPFSLPISLAIFHDLENLFEIILEMRLQKYQTPRNKLNMMLICRGRGMLDHVIKRMSLDVPINGEMVQ